MLVLTLSVSGAILAGWALVKFKEVPVENTCIPARCFDFILYFLAAWR